MAIRDLLIGEDPKAQERLQDSPLPTEPQIGVIDQIGVAIDRPSITGGALTRWLQDKAQGSEEYSPEELSRIYPDAPPGTFTARNTRRMGDWLNKRAMNEDLYSNMNKVRSMGHGSTYNAITDVGYGIVQETSPTDILLGIATGGLVNAAAAGANMALKAGSMNLGLRGLSYLGQSTTKAIIASEVVEGILSVPMDYAIRYGLEDKVQEKASLSEAAMGALGGAVLSSGLRLTGRQIAKRFSKNIERMDPATRQAFGNALEEELNAMTTPGTNWEMQGKFSELDPVRRLPVDDRLRYKVYSAAEGIPRSMGEMEGSGGLYALYNKSSTMSHNGAASPFGQSMHLTDNVGDLTAYSASIKQAGQVVQLDPSEFKILDLSKLKEGSSESVAIKKILEDAGVKSTSLTEGFDALRKMDEQGDLIEFEIQEYLKDSGYEGITLTETSKILDKAFTKNNTFIFDGIEGKNQRIVSQLDGSLAGLPESTAFFQNTKANALKNGEGVMTNGKQIKLDPQGYFNTDPFYGHPEKALAYTEYFDADQIAEINTKVESGNPKALKKKYQGLTDDLIEHVRQLNIMKEFEDAQNIQDLLSRSTRYNENTSQWKKEGITINIVDSTAPQGSALHPSNHPALKIASTSKATSWAYATDANGKVVGKSSFISDGKRAMSFDVGVDKTFQRKGIATGMYAKMEQYIGKTIEPSSALTKEGKAFWDAPNKPFGELKVNDLLPEEAQLDLKTERDLLEKLMLDRGNYEANKKLIQKTVEQQAKEGKVMRLLEKMDFDKITKKFIDRVEKRIGTPQESQTESIIRQYNDIVEKMKQNNPEIVDELVKATDFCLRKYTL
jgi:hypothetical protein